MAMDTPIFVALITVAGSVIVAAGGFYLTKKKEREADWRKYKFEQYKEFMASMSGSLGRNSTQEGQLGFAKAFNALHLIGSPGVLKALHQLQNELAIHPSVRSLERHDALLSKLVWEIRKDSEIPGTPGVSEFSVHLAGPGPDSDKQATL